MVQQLAGQCSGGSDVGLPDDRPYELSQSAVSTLIRNGRACQIGVQFHSLSDDQLAEWRAAGGYQRSEWDTFKKELAGSMANFAKLEEAANIQGQYYVHDA